jgi:peptidoglycan/xylan/chitin deacetylase (PgdA/CDA1 family)
MDTPAPLRTSGLPPVVIPFHRGHRRAARLGAGSLAIVLIGSVVHASATSLSAGSALSQQHAAVLTAAIFGPSPAGSIGQARRPDPNAAMFEAAAIPVEPVLGPAARLVYRVHTTQKLIALTFDDGWSPPAGRLILDTLLRQDVPATFFVNAMYVRWDPALWKQIAAAGFAIGNHTYDHRFLTKLSPATDIADIQKDARVFEELTGYPIAPIFRPPYGARNRAVDAAVRLAGYPTEILWDTAAGDTNVHLSDARLIANATAGRAGSIVLMHIGPASTPRILAAVIASYRARGFTFVTIPQLLAAGGH